MKTKPLSEVMIEAWWRRTLPVVDLDTGKETPSPTMKEWKKGVKKDIKSLLNKQRVRDREEWERQHQEFQTSEKHPLKSYKLKKK